MGHLFVRVRLVGVALFFVLSILESAFAQAPRPSPRQIEEDWKNYTSFQKNELLNFCDFLFDASYYERCVLASFRFIFLYPDDELVPLVHYRIARSYEESGSWDLALEYYSQVQTEMKANSSGYTSALHRTAYLELARENYDKVHEMASGNKDVYLTVFDGYASISELKWDEAKRSFEIARRRFGPGSHDRLLRRLIRACAGASSIPKKKASTTGLFAVLPGGGRIYQGDWNAALGILVCTAGLGFQIGSGGSSFIASWIPRLAIVAVYGGSFAGSVRDVEYANRELMKRYARGVMRKLGPENFLDFPEPGHLSTEGR